MKSARPLRIYYADRLVQTVPHTVRKVQAQITVLFTNCWVQFGLEN